MKINEENYVIEMKKKNEDALVYFIDNHGWVVKSIIKAQLHNLDNHIEECMNDVFISIWNNINSYNDKKGSFLNWVGAITRYKVIDYKRKYLKTIYNENIYDVELSYEDNVNDEIIREENEKELKELLSCLSKSDRELFIKLFIEEKTSGEISEEMGIKKEVLYNHVSRGKKKLRRFLEGGKLKSEKKYL